MAVDAQAYLTAFDHWLSHQIYEAVRKGKDLAFCERRINSKVKFDGGPVWDHVLLDPGAEPPQGPAWTVYRLHGQDGAAPVAASVPASAKSAPHRRQVVETLAEQVFGPF
jgi:hypothetical protein